MTKFQVPSSKLQVTKRVASDKWRVTRMGARAGFRVTRHPSPVTRGFTLIEMLVTLVLMSLIVLALMAVFNSTQQAFRSSLTQTDILESGRNVMGLITADLETMSPSGGGSVTNLTYPFPPYVPNSAPVNFYATNNLGSMPLIQSLTASPTGVQRTNVLENFFILSRQNVNGTPSWVGTGYAVDSKSFPTNSLYRFFMSANMVNGDPWRLFAYFVYGVQQNAFTNTANWSHLMDGVMDLTVAPYDPNGLKMTNTYEYHYNGQLNLTFTNHNTLFFPQTIPGGVGFYMFSNTVPASVEVEMGVLENATLKHAEGLPSYEAQTNYLFNHVGQLHLFRQRVWIRNVDPSAYQ